MQDTRETRYQELKSRGKKVLFEQYRRVMEEHDNVVKAYEQVTKDDMIFFIMYYA